MTKSHFTWFENAILPSENRIALANDIYLIHQAFYTFLAVYAEKFNSQEHRQILQDELGISKRGQSPEYGAIPHGKLWLLDLNVLDSQISMLNNEHIQPFQRLCYKYSTDKKAGKAFIAAVESVADDYVRSIGKAIQNSAGYQNKTIWSVYVHCDPVVGIEVKHAQETSKFVDDKIFTSSQETVIQVFLSLYRHFESNLPIRT